MDRRSFFDVFHKHLQMRDSLTAYLVQPNVIPSSTNTVYLNLSKNKKCEEESEKKKLVD